MARKSGASGLITAVALIASCTTTAAPDQTPSPEQFELGAGPAMGIADGGGIVVEIWLDRTKVQVGDMALALVRVSNRGDKVVQREGNTCGTGPARTIVVQHGADGQPAVPVGREWPGLAGEFKHQILSEAGLGVERDLGRFTDATMLGGNILCTLESKVGPFGPGAADQMVLGWRAAARQGSILVAGPALVRATFETAHISFNAPGEAPVLTVTAEAPIDIVGREPNEAEPAVLTLVDYVDAALSDAAFREWLETVPQETWINPIVTYWPTEEGNYPEMPPFNRLGRRPVVEIGLARLAPVEDVRMVIVDRQTGEVLASRDQ